MSDKVEYHIIVDKEMFPYPPGSEVVVKDSDGDWKGDIFLYRKQFPLQDRYSYECSMDSWDECHPLATHAHLIGTTYQADTPACTKCGKAAPEPMLVNDEPYCAACFEEWSKGTPSKDNQYDLGLDKPQFEPFQRVLVRDFDNAQWYPDIFLYLCYNNCFPYCCAKKQPRQCIPYDGNEHLLGTTNAPEGA